MSFFNDVCVLDLMHPGILGTPSKDIPIFSKGSTVAINTESNVYPVAIGIALKSSHEIYYSSGKFLVCCELIELGHVLFYMSRYLDQGIMKVTFCFRVKLTTKPLDICHDRFI